MQHIWGDAMTTARDNYPEYFAEKLWEWLPAHYRDLDQSEGGGALRAFIESLADQAALLKRSQDRLWDDAFVELASDWAVPYIAQLVGTRLVSAQNPRARRADVAKTIYYRRRAGTLPVLEQLIADIAGWQGTVIEEMGRLARMRHGLDGTALRGRVTGTPEGGLADLRSSRSALLGGGPFDEFNYTPDMRRPNGESGRRGIAKLSFHLYRLGVVEFRGVQPRRMRRLAGAFQGFTFDPSGRDLALFSPGDATRTGGEGGTIREWSLPLPISCSLLGDAHYLMDQQVRAWIMDESRQGVPIPSRDQRLAVANDLRRLEGELFTDAASLRRLLAGLPSAPILTQESLFAGLLLHGLVDECGSAALLPDETGDTTMGAASLGLSFTSVERPPMIPRHRSCSANLDDWSAAPPAGVEWVVQPEKGRFLVNRGGNSFASLRVRYHQVVPAAVGAGALGREPDGSAPGLFWNSGAFGDGTPADGAVLIQDSASYVNPPDQPTLVRCQVRAAEGERPYLRLNNFWRLGAGTNNAELTLDGLWIGTRSVPRSVVLQGMGADANFERATLRYCTLDPGGIDANGGTLPAVTLVIDCFVEELLIENCILAGIRLQGSDAAVSRLIVRDSIIHSRTPGSVAIDLATTHLCIQRSTLLAPSLSETAINVERIHAEDTLVAGLVHASDSQNGCFRFCARSAGSTVPHPYRSQLLGDGGGLFASRRFGDPHYLRLSDAAPVGISRGASNGSEMGAFCRENEPARLDSLLTKIHEFTPFGRLPNLIREN